MRVKILLLSLLIATSALGQSDYKQMMNDMQVNFYDVVEAADKYFETHTKGKGSGWKGYQRWKAENESKYYPDGNRSQINPYFLAQAHKQFKEKNPVNKSLFSGEWRDLGPYDANNITSHYSPGIGRVECFWINPVDTTHMFMGSRSGGFWMSSNAGASWINTTDHLIASGVNTIAVSPGNSDTVLINIQNASNNTTHGIFRSVDGGATWAITPFSPVNLGWGGLGTNNKIFKIVYHPTIPNLVFVGTSMGVYKSTDNLATWTQELSNSDITDIEFHPTNPDMLYVYDDYYWSNWQNVIFRSNDLGQTYTESNTIAGNNDAKGHIAVTPECPDCVYFASSNGVWKSTDTGINFTFLTDPEGSCHGFAVSDIDSSSMIYAYVDTYASINGGATFDQVTWWANGTPDGTYVHADIRAAECLNGVYYMGTDGYLAKSNDNGITWQRLNDGTGIREFYAVGLSQSNWNVQMAGSQDNGTSILNANGWIEWNGGDGMEAIALPLNPDWMIGSWQYGTRQRTIDGGQTRQGISTPQSGSDQADWLAPLLFNPNHQMKVYHFSDSVFVSNKFGGDWHYVGSPGIGKVKIAAIAENNSALMVVGRNDELYLSQDTGATFTSISNNLPSYSITDIAFDPRHDSTLVVVYNRYQNDGKKVYISHNLGADWTNITSNLGDMPIRTVVIDHSAERNIYLGAEIGVYYKPMDATDWISYSPGLATTTVRDLEIQYGTNVLRAATWGRGLWEYTLAGRNDYPAILTTEITNPPTLNTPGENFDQYITSVVSYDGILSEVFVQWSLNSIDFSNSISMSNTQDSTWVSQNAIPNYPPGSNIYFKVLAVGANGDTTETYKFMYTVVEFKHCESYGNMNYTTAVTLVDFNGIYNSTGKTQPYTDYSATSSASVEAGNTYTLNVNLDTDGNYEIYARVWVDWNRDGDFEDADESYDLGTAQNTANGPTSLSPYALTVPLGAAGGETKLRVAAKYSSTPIVCETGFDGEVEDYALYVSCQAAAGSLSVESCDEYTSPSGLYSYGISGLYSDTLLTMSGCDSIISIDLTIINIDTAITEVQGVLSAEAVGSTYQWIDCNDNYSWISSAQSQSFTPDSNGSYAVIISQNGCVDTSNCYNVLLVGLGDMKLSEMATIYPNPSSGLFVVDLGAEYSDVTVELKDVMGKIIHAEIIAGARTIQMQTDLSSGVYFVAIHSGNEKAVLRLLIK